MGVCKAASRPPCATWPGTWGQRSPSTPAGGPLATVAAKSIRFKALEERWGVQAPLGWTSKDQDAVARTACALLSDFFPSTTGELIHVDGGYHAMGAPPVAV